MTVILAIETCFKSCSVGLFKDSEMVNFLEITEHHKQSEQIVNLISQVTDNNLDIVTHIAVNNGPGTFTGIRVGLTATEAILLSKPQIKIIYVSSLEAVSVNFESCEDKSYKLSFPTFTSSGGYYSQIFYNGLSVSKIDLLENLPKETNLITQEPSAREIGLYACKKLKIGIDNERSNLPKTNYIRDGNYISSTKS